MFKGKISLILLIVISTIFIVGLIKIGGKVEAQINGFGAACVENFANCATTENPDSKVITEVIKNFNIRGNEFSRAQYQEALQINYDNLLEELNSNMCSDTSIYNGEIIPYWGENNGFIVSDRAGLDVTAHACPAGYEAQFDNAASPVNPGNDYTSWGCCPTTSNYQFITISAGDAATTQTNSACCLIPNGANPGDVNYPTALSQGGGGASVDDCRGPSTNPNFTSGEPIWSDVSSDQNRDGVAEPTVLFLKPGAGSFNTDFKINGLPIDARYIAGNDGEIVSKTGASMSCNLPTDDDGNKLGCSLVEDDGSIILVASPIVSGGKNFQVVNANDLTSDAASDIKCERCYEDGDPIIIENLNSDSGASPNLILCDLESTDGPMIRRTPLINNSIADTLAALRAQDEENRDFIIECTAGGGIPTAIGCVDASPIGIITGLIRIALGVIGGVALISLIIVGIQYQRGNDEEIKKARDRLIAILTGVAFLVFSVLILRILGVNILDVIPAGSI